MALTLWQMFTTPVHAPDKILTKGTVEFFYAGTTGSSNRRPIYLDVDGTVEAANPYTLDSNATASLYSLSAERFHVIIKDKHGVIFYDFDHVRATDTIAALIDAAQSFFWDYTATGGETVLSPPYVFSSATVSIDGLDQNVLDPNVLTIADNQITFATPLTAGQVVFAVIGAQPTSIDDLPEGVNKC